MKRLLVTRPEPAASNTADALKIKGFSPLMLPLTEIIPLSPTQLPDPVDIDAVAVTSANAVRHAPSLLLNLLHDRPAFAVGPRTAALLRERGFEHVTPGGGNGTELAQRIARDTGIRSLAYLCGRVRTPDFEDGLRQTCIDVETVEIYDTRPLRYENGLPEDLLRASIDAVLLYSAYAAKLFVALMERNGGLDRSLAKARFLCMSAKVASALSPKWQARADVAAKPTEAALKALLSQI